MRTKGYLHKLIYCIAMVTVFMVCFIAVGCQQAPMEGETYRKVAVAWPLFDFENTEGALPDGTTWRREKGDAVVWLSTWDKLKKYDKDKFLIYRKEKSAFFPFFVDELEESKDFRLHKGAILIFPFYSKSTKSELPETKP